MSGEATFTLTFPSTVRSPYFDDVLDLARACPGYEEISRSSAADGRSRRRSPTLHRIRFASTPVDMGRLAELWERLHGWTAARLLAGETPISGPLRYRMLEVLACAARAAALESPRRYCWSAGAPCRLLATRGRPATTEDQLWAELADLGATVCPFLEMPVSSDSLARPLRDNVIDFRRREVDSGA